MAENHLDEFTYERLLGNALSRVPSTVDKREGSIIYDAIAPICVELAQVYIELKNILTQTFADTASREYLIKRVAERGIVPKPAVPAVFKGEFNIDIPIGARFSSGHAVFAVTERIGFGQFKMQCEANGEAGNRAYGNLLPLDFVDGLTKAQLTELLIPGQEEEDTESIRQRYFDSLNAQAFGGNRADYKEKVNALSGVGGVKIYRGGNGGGTVKVVIINSAYQKPSSILVNDIQTIIDPVQNSGEGVGIAPIDHMVTVVGVNEFPINITTNLVCTGDWTWEDVRPYIEQAIDKYFNDLAKEWEDNENLIVRISHLETRFLGTQGVLDVSGTTINGQTQNLMLDADSIPVRGELLG